MTSSAPPGGSEGRAPTARGVEGASPARLEDGAPPRELAIVLLVAAVQLVNVLEFMMVMPLGPDFAKSLDIDLAHLGIIGGSYTASAAVTGLIGAMYLDRFDRKAALTVCMLGLAVGTLLGALSQGLPSLLAARVLAGAFGGPATSLAMSIVADVVPPHRRGRAMAIVMGAFSVASVLGVPSGLELAGLESIAGYPLWGWRTPFFVVVALILVVTIVQAVVMPPMRAHLERAGPPTRLLDVVARPGVGLTLLMMATVMFAMFSIVPNISAYIQFNAHYPREHLGRLYFAGGLCSLTLMTLTGRLTDRFGSFPMIVVATALIVTALGVGFGAGAPLVPPLAFFIAFMGSTSIRNVALNALTSRVPPAHERARFQSVQSAVTHLACAAGASFSSLMLVERPDHSLEGIPTLAAISIALTALAPALVPAITRAVKAREATAQG